MLKKAIGNVAKKSSVSTAGDLCQKLKAIRVSIYIIYIYNIYIIYNIYNIYIINNIVYI